MPESLTVAELCGAVEIAFEQLFPDEVWVRGSISGLKRSANGHVYFDLVDADLRGDAAAPVLPVALFANNKHRVNAILKKSGGAVKMTDGIEIQIRGRITYYPRQGRVQLIMSLIDPAFTLGQLEANRAAVLAELAAEGLLQSNKAVPLPVAPFRIALVTSVGSAAEADFVDEIQRSGLPFEITLIDARTQGDDAVPSLVAAFAALESELLHRFELDAVAVVRGGGARTDLVAFDHREVARAIARCPLPVVVGIGHEIDRSIADEVAHRSVKTPTACAAVFVDAARDFERRVDELAAALVDRVERALQLADNRVGDITRRVAAQAGTAIHGQDLRIELHADRIGRAARSVLGNERARVEQADATVRALDPIRALARGWSITRGPDGRVLRSCADAPVGGELTTELADGSVVSTVERAEPSEVAGTVGNVTDRSDG